MFSYRISDELKLVLPTTNDAGELYQSVRANLEQLKLWMPWATDDYSIETARAFIKANLHEFAANDTFAASIVLDEKIVGTIGFHHLDAANQSVHIGYWLDRRAQGKGLATESCRALVNYAFEDLRLNRIQINCGTENAKSRAVPERLGFRLEGVQRQVERLNGEFRDWAIYALLKDDWNELKFV